MNVKTPVQPNAIRFIGGIAEVVADYDGFLVDVWGVLHDGAAPFPATLSCLRELRAAGKKVVLLSNVARRAQTLADDLAALGIGPELYDCAVTSGESVWSALRNRTDPWHARLGRRCLFLGPGGPSRLLEGLDLESVASVEVADFLLAARTLKPGVGAEVHDPLLVAAAARGLPMLCANPDLVAVVRGNRIVCPGAIARRYEDLGGNVFYHGKPHGAIYDRALDLLGIGDRGRACGIGDSLITDISGAGRAGLGTMLVASGVHAEDIGPWPPDADRIEALCRRSGSRPHAVAPAFCWNYYESR